MHLQARLVLRVMVELVGLVRQVVSDAAAHRYCDFLAHLGLGGGHRRACQLRPEQQQQQQRARRPRVRPRPASLLPSPPSLRARPTQAGETGAVASLSAELCVAYGLATCWLLCLFKISAPRATVSGKRCLPRQAALSSSPDRAGEGQLRLQFQRKYSLKQKLGEKKNCNLS